MRSASQRLSLFSFIPFIYQLILSLPNKVFLDYPIIAMTQNWRGNRKNTQADIMAKQSKNVNIQDGYPGKEVLYKTIWSILWTFAVVAAATKRNPRLNAASIHFRYFFPAGLFLVLFCVFIIAANVVLIKSFCHNYITTGDRHSIDLLMFNRGLAFHIMNA